jgi:hypothetical protein
MSDPLQKPRSDSRLKTLPEERQEAIVEYARSHSVAETVGWLRDDGVKTSHGALSEFLSWFKLRRRFQIAEQDSLNLVELLRQKRPAMSEAERQEWANDFFQVQAIKDNDPDTFLAFSSARFKAELEKEKLRIKQEELQLAKQKFHRETSELFLKWSEDKQAREIATSNATNAEKIERLGQLMFGEDWKE